MWPSGLLCFVVALSFNQTVDNHLKIIKLNHMVEYHDDANLSALLKAASDTTRRSLLTELCQQGPCRVTDLAKQYAMSLNAISKHIKVLERCGLVTRKTLGRVHWIEADLAQVSVVENWFATLKSIWQLRLEKLAEIVETENKK
jgi:DNA-binding transcriptional ArsR family regulator